MNRYYYDKYSLWVRAEAVFCGRSYIQMSLKSCQTKPL